MLLLCLDLRCPTVNGEQIQVTTFGGFGGQAAAFGMEISVGEFDGKWLAFSLQGNTIPPGYFHLTTLNINSLESYGCDPDSFGLIGGVVTDINVRKKHKKKPQGELSSLHNFGVRDWNLSLLIYCAWITFC